MLYEIAHLIKNKCAFLWNVIEWSNDALFQIAYRRELKEIPSILNEISNETFTIRIADENDAPDLVRFFSEQQDEAYRFFNPHGFDIKSVLRVLHNKAFMTFIVTEEDSLVGYFFLRSFINGKCFKGRIVDYRQRNRGIAKLMGLAINKVAGNLGLRIYTTISPENYASLASTKAVNDIRIVKTLENGYYYIECTPKQSQQYAVKPMVGGVNQNDTL